VTGRIALAINHYLCPPGTSLPAFLDIITTAGFDAVGLTQRALDEMPIAYLKRELAARDLAVTSVNSAGAMLGLPVEQQQARNRHLVDQAAALGAGVLNFLPGHDPQLSFAEAQIIVSDALDDLADYARPAGVRLVLEPLHARHARIGSCLNTIADVRRMLDRSGTVSLNLDLFHLWEDPERDLAVEGQGPVIGLVQICDIGRSNETVTRLPLGEGDIHGQPFFQKVRERQPGVPMELELFADQLPARSAAEIIAETARLLRAGDDAMQG
jgi:sugar phosphate isomerase/epimerase